MKTRTFNKLVWANMALACVGMAFSLAAIHTTHRFPPALAFNVLTLVLNALTLLREPLRDLGVLWQLREPGESFWGCVKQLKTVQRLNVE